MIVNTSRFSGTFIFNPTFGHDLTSFELLGRK